MRKSLIIISFLCLFVSTHGQISIKGTPHTWGDEMNLYTAPIIKIPIFDKEQVVSEALDKGSFQFGISHEVDIDLQNSGIWYSTNDGGRVWLLNIESDDAVSFNLSYDKFWLPNGAKFYIYSTDKTSKIGAFTSLNNKGSKEDPQSFATGLIKGKSITLEYYEPKGVSGGIISIDKVVSGFKDVEEVVSTRLATIDTDSDEYGDILRSLTIIVSGDHVSTGFLVNNSDGNNKPYVLSHLSDEGALSKTFFNDNSLFYWNTQGLANLNADYSTVGCETLGHVSNTIIYNAIGTVSLLELDENPIMLNDFAPYYLGWNYSSIIPTDYTITFIENDSWQFVHDVLGLGNELRVDPLNENFLYYNLLNDRRCYRKESFGAPLFNISKQVVAIGAGLYDYHSSGGKSARSVSDYCDDRNMFYYARFYSLWNQDWYRGTSEVQNFRLSEVLDPSGITSGYLDGIGAGCNDLLITNQTITTSKNFSACNLTVSNTTISNNATVVLLGDESVVLKPTFKAQQGTTVVVQVNNNSNSIGLRSASLANDTNEATSLEAEALVQDVDVYPNPVIDIVNIDGYEAVTSLQLYSSSGSLVMKQDFANQTLDMSHLPEGIYILKLQTANGTSTHKLMKR